MCKYVCVHVWLNWFWLWLQTYGSQLFRSVSVMQWPCVPGESCIDCKLRLASSFSLISSGPGAYAPTKNFRKRDQIAKKRGTFAEKEGHSQSER